ncbi:hypothetical protein FRX31_034818 [Thalictrum thalictroides]|uniref:RNase H type-1 domain-containing protein n=1 Tax=Thalictrum thalictroides TaxID=46969 RepID=A0A7J6USS5_THATH|nr:hypothetical protein FRX31_034818 [Thalictrum thalictroides]
MSQNSYINTIFEASIWTPPQAGYVKMNVDIAFSGQTTPIGIGYILRDETGMFMLVGTESGKVETSEEAECQGIRAAVRRGIQQQLLNVIVEFDNLSAIDHLNGRSDNLAWQSATILDQALSLAKYFLSIM